MQTAPKDLIYDNEVHRRAAARVGDLVSERWRLDSLIGVGGMASVYAATHRNGRRVAIKILHPELSTDPQHRQRFIDEGYVANHVKHAGTVSVLDDGETVEGLVFLVMDLLEGQTLEERLQKQGRLHHREILAIAEGLLSVLAAAHDEGIVHRDIKPGNIFILHDATVRLLDFGIARSIVPGHAQTTEWGVPMGTPEFMPPEQARGHWELVDGRTDLWAVGATMFTALTGRAVHVAATTNEVLLAAMTRTAPSLGDVVPGSSERLVQLVDRALAFAPSGRWPSAREMQTALQSVQAELGWQQARIAPIDECPGPVIVRRRAVRSSRAPLVPRAMWVAKTRSWYVLPAEGASNISSSIPGRPRARRRRGILAGAAAFAIAFIGRTGHPPPTRADVRSVATPQLARAIDPVVDAVGAESEVRADQAVPADK